MKIAVRLDDITEDMDWEKFLRFKELLSEYGIKPLLGVIPENLDDSIKGSDKGKPEDFWAYLKELSNEGYVLSQHGTYHIYTTTSGGLFPLNKQSEFAGKSYELQYGLLEEGKNILLEHGIETDIFMAPSHSYDRKTLKALKELGFTAITDGFGYAPYTYYGIDFYPISFKRGDTLKSTKEGYSTLVFHTNTMKDKDFESFERILRDNKEKFISYGDYLEAKKKDCTILHRISEYLMADIKRFMVRFL